MASRPPRSRAGVLDHSRSGPNRSAARRAWTYSPRAYNSRIGARSAVGICMPLSAPGRVSLPGSVGLFGGRGPGRLGERPEDVEHVAQLGQPHPVAVQELSERELVLDRVGVLVGQAPGQVVQEAQERPLDERERLLTPP